MKTATDRSFRAGGTRLREIRDGTSSTACLVPIDAAAGISWTEPKDMAVDPARDQVTGRRLRVTGRLGPYGGRSKRLEGRKQITVDAPADIAFAEPGGDDARRGR
jgi:hypothetical protein